MHSSINVKDNWRNYGYWWLQWINLNMRESAINFFNWIKAVSSKSIGIISLIGKIWNSFLWTLGKWWILITLRLDSTMQSDIIDSDPEKCMPLDKNMGRKHKKYLLLWDGYECTVFLENHSGYCAESHNPHPRQAVLVWLSYLFVFQK